jgi:flavin reductase (DIM6/NTAB) family NADH-FMN oxidoreductase RutF
MGTESRFRADTNIDATVRTITESLNYPMLVVTATAGDQRAGCLVGFSSKCSIDPNRFIVWLSKLNYTLGVAEWAEWLVLHFPDAHQRALAELFGSETGDDIDKFSRCSWHEGPAGTTILDECTRWLAGPVGGNVDGGDHVGFLVEPTHGMAGPWTGPLAFGMVQDLTPGHPAS